jgi:3-keto-disaccharide hydrolase
LDFVKWLFDEECVMRAALLFAASLFAGFTIVLLGTLPVEGQQASNNTLSPTESKAGWTLLFDGRTLSGLSPTGNADWKVEDGTLAATKGTGFLVTPKAYGNFELKAEFWADKAVNSGIFIRCAEGAPGATGCYEANIFDAHAQWPTGSIVNVKSVLPDKPNTTEKWNMLEITADGSHLVLKLNGKTTVDARDERRANGTIALQEGGGNASGLIRFRNVKIRPF